MLSVLIIATVFSLMTVALWLIVMADQRRLREQVLHMAHSKAPTAPVLGQAARRELEQAAADRLRHEIDAGARKLSADLRATGQKVGGRLDKLATTAVERELEQYRQVLSENRTKTAESLAKARAEIEARQVAVRETLDKGVADAKARRLRQFDDRIADVVSSYLVETLGDEADLGVQGKYLLASLEKDKSRLRKDITSG